MTFCNSDNDSAVLADANVLVNAPRELAAGKVNAKYTHTGSTNVAV